jgi:hypothetical protein
MPAIYREKRQMHGYQMRINAKAISVARLMTFDLSVERSTTMDIALTNAMAAYPKPSVLYTSGVLKMNAETPSPMKSAPITERISEIARGLLASRPVKPLIDLGQKIEMKPVAIVATTARYFKKIKTVISYSSFFDIFIIAIDLLTKKGVAPFV